MTQKTIKVLGEEFEVKKIQDGFSFEWTSMYSAPELTFKQMKEISDYFGTEEINFDNTISLSGCETCDYGSKYGFEIEVFHPTKNNPF